MDFYGQLPKAELHLHLRGAMPVSVFLQLVEKYPPNRIIQDVPPERRDFYLGARRIQSFLDKESYGEDEVSELFRFSDFENFIYSFSFSGVFFRDGDDFRALVEGVIAELVRQNVVYAEITVSVYEYLRNGIELEELSGILRNTRTGRRIRVNWIVDLVRNFGPELGLDTLRQIVELPDNPFVAITIGGDETSYSARAFKEVYDLARDAGLGLSVHAGEGAGPDNVWGAIRDLRVDRIGHGVRAIEDPKLVEYLAANGTPLEICPTSNLRTGVFTSLAEHPAKRLYDAGVPITVNTDDPTFFGCDLAGEYMALTEMGFPGEDLYRVIENGFEYAFLPEDDKKKYISEFASAYAELTAQ